MSYYSIDATSHDSFVSIGIFYLKKLLNADLEQADGGLPFTDHITDSPEKFGSYKPDAILKNGQKKIVLEVKTEKDFLSTRSCKQFQSFLPFLQLNENLSIYYLIYSSSGSSRFLERVCDYMSNERVNFIRDFEGVSFE